MPTPHACRVDCTPVVTVHSVTGHTSPRASVRRSRRFYESVGPPRSDEHTLRTFDAWHGEERA